MVKIKTSESLILKYRQLKIWLHLDACVDLLLCALWQDKLDFSPFPFPSISIVNNVLFCYIKK